MFRNLTQLSLFLSFLGIFSLSANTAAKPPLLIGVHGEAQENYQKFLNGRDPLKLKDFSGKFAYRDNVEQVLLLQALDKGGYQANSQLVAVDFYKRRLRLIQRGEIHLSATPLWYKDLVTAEGIFISPAIIKEGEFSAGLYVFDKNKHLLAKQSLSQVKKLYAVSNRNWLVDWQVLTEMNLAGLNHSGQFPLMTKMLVKGRADFMLAPFYNSKDLSFIEGGHKFIPIPNIKVVLPGSRHFALSHNHPDFIQIKTALIKGLAILHQQGTIKKAYRQSGFFNQQVSQWRIINE